MARITNEDCLVKVPNSFELITIASHRSREISTGSAPKIELKHKNEKPTVIALREIASGIVDVNEVREYLIESKRTSNTVANMLKQAEEAEAEMETAGTTTGSKESQDPSSEAIIPDEVVKND